MEKNRRFHKLLLQFSATYIYGIEGDYGRYRMLRKLSDVFLEKEFLINRYLRDKVKIIVYPRVFGDSILAVINDELYAVNTVDQIKEVKCDTLFIPGKDNISDRAYIFPIEGFEEKINNACEVIFVESFPYGKKEFCDFVLEFVRTQGISCNKCVVLCDEGRKYGATDISDERAGFRSVTDKLSSYVDRICNLSDYKYEYPSIDIRKSCIEKKRVLLNDSKRLFLTGYDSEFEFFKYRWLCNEDKRGILTDSCFEYISDYKNVKNSDNVEKTILDNMIAYTAEQKKEICNMIFGLLNTYLVDFENITSEEVDKCYDELIKEIKKAYKYGKKEKCPISKLDYRVLCSNNQYVIKLRTYFEKIFDEFLKAKIRLRIKETLDECEVEYCEKLKD